MTEMTEILKKAVFNYALPVLASVTVGFGSAVYSTNTLVGQLDMKIAALEATVESHAPLPARVEKLEIAIDRHEKALDRDFARHEQTVSALGMKTDDQEKRLTRLETLVGETQALLTEIRADVKILLRGGQQ